MRIGQQIFELGMGGAQPLTRVDLITGRVVLIAQPAPLGGAQGKRLL